MEALEIYRLLAKTGSLYYEQEEAIIAHDLADMYIAAQRYKESELLYLEALEIYRRVSNENPDAYKRNIVTAVYSIGFINIQLGQYPQAIPYFEEALELYREMAKTDNSAQEWYDASLHWLGSLYNTCDEHAKAYTVYEEFLPITKLHYQQAPDAYRDNYVSYLGSQSFQCIFVGEFEKSEQYAREALSINPDKHWIVTNLAASLLFQGKYEEAVEIYSQYKDELKTNFLDDFDVFEAEKVIPKKRKKDVEKIKKMLKE